MAKMLRLKLSDGTEILVAENGDYRLPVTRFLQTVKVIDFPYKANHSLKGWTIAQAMKLLPSSPLLLMGCVVRINSTTLPDTARFMRNVKNSRGVAHIMQADIIEEGGAE